MTYCRGGAPAHRDHGASDQTGGTYPSFDTHVEGCGVRGLHGKLGPTRCCRFVTPWDHGGGPSSGTDGSHRDCAGITRCRPHPHRCGGSGPDWLFSPGTSRVAVALPLRASPREQSEAAQALHVAYRDRRPAHRGRHQQSRPLGHVLPPSAPACHRRGRRAAPGRAPLPSARPAL